MRAELVRTLPVRNVLGESILWDDLGQLLWWTDIQSDCLYRYVWQTGELRSFELPERCASLGLVEGAAELICAFASGIALYDTLGGATRWLYRPEQGFRGTRFNDGRVDRQGRFWSGTMVENEPALDASGNPVRGSLYCVFGSEQRKLLTGIGISNSLCWSPDGATMYLADSTANEIRAFAFDTETGTPGPGRHFASAQVPGVPDGSTIDQEGFLWNAQWDGSRVVRYAPSGAIDFELQLPVSRPTCVSFGGPVMNLLCISSATEGMTESQLAKEPEAGNVLVYETSFRGIPECRYRGGQE